MNLSASVRHVVHTIRHDQMRSDALIVNIRHGQVKLGSNRNHYILKMKLYGENKYSEKGMYMIYKS
jgi:hypothetical protein